MPFHTLSAMRKSHANLLAPSIFTIESITDNKMSSSASSSRSSTPVPSETEVKSKKASKRTVEEVSDSDSDESADEAPSPDEQEEETVLSHAERRRQKKEAKRAEKLKEGDRPAEKKRKLADGAAQTIDKSSSATPRKNSVWVGNMSFKTQQDNLRTFFKDVGEITRINMPTKPPAGPGMKPENRGFAYVDFATVESKAAAIALSEQPLIGRKLLIKDGDSFEGRPAALQGENVITDPSVAHKTHSKTAQKILRAQKQPAGPTLFFGNLGFETTDESIRQLLEAHRQVDKKKGKEKDTAEGAEDGAETKPKDVWIRKVRMGTFEDSGLCKGFAFVDFTTIDNATSALINPRNHHLNGRNLLVEYASPDAVRRGAPKSARAADGAANVRGRRPLSAGYKKTRTHPSDTKWKDDSQKDQETQTSHDEPAHVEAESDPKARREKKDRSPSKVDRVDGVRHKGPKSRPKL